MLPMSMLDPLISEAPWPLWLCRIRYARRVVPSGQVRCVARTVSVAVRTAWRPGARGHGHMADSVVTPNINRSRLRSSDGKWRCR